MTQHNSPSQHERSRVPSSVLAKRTGCIVTASRNHTQLFQEVTEAAKEYGRLSDVRLLKMTCENGVEVANTFNPFSFGKVDEIRELLARQLDDTRQNDIFCLSQSRAVFLVRMMSPVLAWLRDHKGVALNIEAIRFSIELRWIWKLAMEKIVLLRDPQTGFVAEMNVEGDIPKDITGRLRSYLSELPEFDPTMPLDQQRSDQASKQHGFAQSYLTAAFTELAVSLGHIFRIEADDIDMLDVVLNRLILVANQGKLKSLSGSFGQIGGRTVADDTLQSL